MRVRDLFTAVVVSLLLLGGFSLSLGATGLMAAENNSGYVAPYNLVVIVLDTSRSFQIPSREPGVEGKVLANEALSAVQRFFREGASQKRRRSEGEDLYVLVAADAASQVIWSGAQKQLAALTAGSLHSMLAVRKQFSQCTDLKAALNAAARVLREHPHATNRYVWTFSDLIAEPPRKSWTDCYPPSGEPPAGIDWKTLGQARLGFYFVSKDFRYRPEVKWRAELDRLGLSAKFLDAAQVLTEGVDLTPPGPAKYKPTPEEVKAARKHFGQVKQFLKSVVKAVAWFLGLSLTGIFLWIQVTRRRRRR